MHDIKENGNVLMILISIFLPLEQSTQGRINNGAKRAMAQGPPPARPRFFMPVRAILPYDTCFLYSYILYILCYTNNDVMLQE